MHEKYPSPYPHLSDIGIAKHFHGRSHILTPLCEVLSKLKKAGRGGTTLLIEGPGGSGKIALLDQCWKMGASMGWIPIDLSYDSMWHPIELLAQIKGQEIHVRHRIHGRTLKDPVHRYSEMSARVKHLIEMMDRVLDGGSSPILLIRRKAHYINYDWAVPPSMASVVRHLFQRIESGDLGRPAVFIAAGNPLTRNSFKKAGYRFPDENIKDIGWLSKDEERLIIRDWMIKDGKAKGPTTEWEDAIIKETHGFPLFTSSYAQHAADHLLTCQGVMTSNGLREVLATGRESKDFYFHHYAFAHIKRKYGGILLDCIHHASPNPYLHKPDIINALMVSGCDRLDAECVFARYVRYGALVKSKAGFSMPMQSMYHALVRIQSEPDPFKIPGLP